MRAWNLRRRKYKPFLIGQERNETYKKALA